MTKQQQYYVTTSIKKLLQMVLYMVDIHKLEDIQ